MQRRVLYTLCAAAVALAVWLLLAGIRESGDAAVDPAEQSPAVAGADAPGQLRPGDPRVLRSLREEAPPTPEN